MLLNRTVLGWLSCAIAVVGMFMQGADGWAGEQTIELREHLNRTWRDQMLTYDFKAAFGQCHPDSVQLTGPSGSMPVQLSEVELWNNGVHLKRAKVSFFVPVLEPLSTQQYVLAFAPAARTNAEAPATDLAVKPMGDRVEITTKQMGIRLLLGQQTLAEPIEAAQAPGPVAGVRMLDGTWTGGSQLYGSSPIKSWKSELLASGPVFAKVQITYTYSDGNVVSLVFRIPAGDRAVEVDTVSQQHQPEQGWELILGGQGVRFGESVLVSGRTYQTREITQTLTPGDDSFAALSAWTGDGWFRSSPMLLRLNSGGEAGQVLLNIRHSGAWYEPRPLERSADFTKWKAGSMGWVWAGWRDTRMFLFAREGGVVAVQSNHKKGRRSWTLSLDVDGKRQLETFTGKDQTAHTSVPRLDEVKEMILDWPDGALRNPTLLMNADELAAAAEKNPAAWKGLNDLEGFRKQLDTLGNYDLMRYTMRIAGWYDALINSPELAPADRKLLRAQAAYLMYRLISPDNWSIERGYNSGNPNMTVSHTLNAGVLALALRDHPLSDHWAEQAARKMDFWLEQVIDEHGYWPESSHYARVSWANMVLFGIAAKRAGVRDYLNHPRFRAAAQYYEKSLTPGDPSRPTMAKADPATPAGAPRVNVPHGRGVRFDVWGFGGMLARATAQSDPEFSKQMQWSWQRTNYSSQRSHAPAGLDVLYTDRDLPAQTPPWSSEFFTHLGYLLRQHVGTPEETYLLLASQFPRNADGEIWPGDVGGIVKWFAYGKPMASFFPRGVDSHVLLNNRVLLAANWNPAKPDVHSDNSYMTRTTHRGFAPLRGLDYVHAQFDITDTNAYGHVIHMPAQAHAFPVRPVEGRAPLQWQRQVMLVDGIDSGSVQYLVLRDSVTGNQPTQWHFWSLTRKLGTPAEAADAEAFLADAPGDANAPLRELTGNRFTGAGQFGVDLEYYIASPQDTPRFTQRFGIAGGAYGVQGKAPTWQDMLHLQLPGDGVYFVVLFPRRPGQKAPEFTTHAEGRVVQIKGDFGQDWAFVSENPTRAQAGDARFEGTAGHVKDRPGGTTLSLAAAGSVGYRDLQLSADQPATLAASGVAIRIDRAAADEAGQIRFVAPGAIKLAAQVTGVELNKQGDTYLLTLPVGVKGVALLR